jgi:predicted dehydrogenase
MSGRIRLGMVGGGQGAFIGAVHRIAARIDDRYELVAGAFSCDPGRPRASAAELHVAPDRAFGRWQEMAAREAARPDGVEVVAIVTPNHMHAEPAIAFLQAGIHVICDKPLCHTMEAAQGLERAAKASRALFALTHNYTGYPLVRQAREMVAEGAVGEVRVVQVEYPQEWLTTALEESGQKQAAWRTDPARSGPVGSVGDIGTHAFYLAEFVTGLQVESLAADLSTFVPGRRLDDNAHMLLRFAGGTRGMLPGCAGQRERATPAGLWRARQPGMGAGAAEPAAAHALRRAAGHDPPGRRRSLAGGGACELYSLRPSRRIPRGLRPVLSRLRRAGGSCARDASCGPCFPARARHRRGHARHALHRGGRHLEPGWRDLGDARLTLDRKCEIERLLQEQPAQHRCVAARSLVVSVYLSRIASTVGFCRPRHPPLRHLHRHRRRREIDGGVRHAARQRAEGVVVRGRGVQLEEPAAGRERRLREIADPCPVTANFRRPSRRAAAPAGRSALREGRAGAQAMS